MQNKHCLLKLTISIHEELHIILKVFSIDLKCVEWDGK